MENINVDDYKVGKIVMTTREFFDLPTSSIGTIVEDYGSGITVEWHGRNLKDGFNKETELQYLVLL